MKLDQARKLLEDARASVAAISAAIARAQAAGCDEVDLRAEDDAARAELQAAIDAAGGAKADG